MADPSGCRRRQVCSCNDDSRRRMENDPQEHRVGENHWRIFSMCSRGPHRKEGSCSGGREHIREHLLSYVPDWTNVYGAFRPYYFADVQTFYRQLCELPEDEI